MPRPVGSITPGTATPVDNTSATPPAPGKRSAPVARDYYFKGDADVSYDAAHNKWLMKLPNTTLTFDQKPAWLKSVDDKNEILDRTADPKRLHAVHDELRTLAEASYDSTSLKFDTPRLATRLAAETDKAFLKDLLALFKIALADETRSTFQYGGAMAGARCSEMHKLGALTGELEKRINALG